jgi:hypothetical protein
MNIGYITSSNPHCAYTLHVLHNKHEYGPTNVIMSVVHPVPKCRRMNSLENLYNQFYRYNIIIIKEQSEEDKIPSLISITTYNASIHAHDPHSCSPVWMSTSVQSGPTWYVTHRQPFSLTIYNFIYQYINKLLLMYLLHFKMPLRCTQNT